MNMMAANLPPDELEKHAAEQRRRLHNSVSDLKSSLTELKWTVEEDVRERLDLRRVARQHLWPLAAGASFVALLLGHTVAGLFTRR
jgi:hypothetical protein